VSNETSWGVTQFVAAAERHGLPKIVSIQNSYHLLNRGPFETDLVEARPHVATVQNTDDHLKH
jgi:aryl-alcohol dehydrogenase-like predicted oxidoreductase